MTNSDLIPTGLSIKEYLENFKITKNNPVHKQRQKLLASIIDAKNKTFEFKQNLSSWNFEYALPLDIADHHTPINKQMLWLSHLLQTIIFWKNKINLPIVSLSGALVSPTNSAYGKRFFYKQYESFSIYNRSGSADVPIDLIKNLNIFEQLVLPSKDFDTQTSFEWLQFWIKFWSKHSINIENQTTHTDQITVFNNQIWKQMWSQDLVNIVPELIFTPLEQICVDVMCEYFENIPYLQLLFQKDSLNDILNSFEGVPMCWNTQKQTGTHFFWFKHPFAPKLVAMKVENGFLVPQKEGLEEYKIAWNQESIIENLRKKNIFPSVLISQAVLTLWTGINPIAGFASTIYLDQMKQKWLKIISKYNYWLELELLQNTPPPFLLAGFNLIMEEGRPVSALDMAFTNGINQTVIKDLLEMRTDNILELNSEIFENYWKNKVN